MRTSVRMLFRSPVMTRELERSAAVLPCYPHEKRVINTTAFLFPTMDTKIRSTEMLFHTRIYTQNNNNNNNNNNNKSKLISPTTPCLALLDPHRPVAEGVQSCDHQPRLQCAMPSARPT